MLSLFKVLSMGCVCAKESIDVKGRRFFVRSRLGEGGFSYVDLVEDSSSHKYFALKRITCHSNEDEKAALEEVEYMRVVDHPNLIPCEVFAKVPVRNSRIGVQSEVFIVMPFYRRGSLWDEIEQAQKKNQHLRETRILHLLRGICDGLKALHQHSTRALAHRDIKPHNVMITEDDEPVLMDFGSMGPARVMITSSSEARSMQDLAAERCTMPYRAPELFNVETDIVIDEAVDIWSLGCTVYAMCFHESPFDDAYQKGGSIALAVLSKVKMPENHSYSEDLIQLIDSMLSVEAGQRPDIDTITQTVDRLQQVAENRI